MAQIQENKNSEVIVEPGATPALNTENNDSFGAKWKKFKTSAKKNALIAKDKIRQRTDMEGLLKQANISLKAFLNPKIDVEQKIPAKLLKECKGIVFMTVAKASFGVGGGVGAGFVIKHNNVYGWSMPCAIGAVGIQWGWNLGVQKTDHIIVLRDDNAMKTFTSKGNLKFGGDAALSVGKTGRNANVSVGINNKADYAAMVSYSMSKGAYIGVALEGQGIALRSDCNQRFYDPNKKFKNKVKYNADAIFSGDYFNMPYNNDYNELINLLNEYTKKIGSNASSDNNNVYPSAPSEDVIM
mmetsp:Transcript_91033/g.111435  ORF Transcript_91033/g.111435 Transcript_91033/m.111435 type:complete len:298 (+) Transcript_91033:80-973(+)